ANNSIATGYRGTVHFASSDNQAVLPADYAFTAADAGIHTLTGMVLKTAGRLTITADDTVTNFITGMASMTVNPAAASQLSFDNQPTDAVASTAIAPAVTVRILDAFGNLEANDNTDPVTLSLPLIRAAPHWAVQLKSS